MAAISVFGKGRRKKNPGIQRSGCVEVECETHTVSVDADKDEDIYVDVDEDVSRYG